MNQPTPRPLPEPLELVFRGSSTGPAAAFACPTCGTLFIPNAKNPAEERKREAAEHCMKTCECGKPITVSYRLLCTECSDRKAAEKEKTRFAKATKLLYEQYEGPVYWEGHEGGLGDGYFCGVDEILDYCATEDVKIPEYVWACSAHEFRLDGERFIENELERQEMYDEAGEGISDDSRKQLQDFLDVWSKAQDIVGYKYDYTRAVLVPKEASAS